MHRHLNEQSFFPVPLYLSDPPLRHRVDPDVRRYPHLALRTWFQSHVVSRDFDNYKNFTFYYVSITLN